MRAYNNIIEDYLNWYADRTGDESYRATNYLNVPDEEQAIVRGIAWKHIMDLCYREKDGLHWFTKFILGDLTYAGYPEPIKFTKLWVGWYDIIKNHPRVAIKCSRQHGKSTFYTVLQTVYRTALFNQYNVLIESATEEQSIMFLDFIVRIIERNEFLFSLKADSSKWSATEIGYNGGKIVARGIGSEVRGGTYDYIVCDDVLRSDNKFSEREIENFIDEELEPMLLVRKGQMIIVGTPKSNTDIFSSIQERAGDGFWQIHTFPAITDWAKQEVLCPERFTFDQLLKIKKTMGVVKFNKEFMCICVDSGSQLFSEESRKQAMELGKDFDAYKSAKKADDGIWSYYMGVDCARSGAVSGDYTVVIVMAVQPDTGMKRVVYMWREKGLKIAEQVSEIARLGVFFNYPIILVEKNNIGQEFIDQLADDYGMSVEAFTTTRNTKSDLIRALISTMENEKLILPIANELGFELSNLISEELGNFVVEVTPAGNEVMKGSGKSHDDIVMALALANKCSQIYGGQAFAFATDKKGSTELERFANTRNPWEIHKF